MNKRNNIRLSLHLLLTLLLMVGVGEAWAEEVTTLYERGTSLPATVWSASDLTDWTANAAGTGFAIDGGLKSSGGNDSYEYQRALTNVNSSAQINITATWNTGSSVGRSGGYNYLSFGKIELRAYGQDKRGTIVINGTETELTNSQSDVRGDASWAVTITVTQGTGDVDYSIVMPSGTKAGTANVGVLELGAIKMGYLKVGRLTGSYQTLQSVNISQTLYTYTVSATGDISQTIVSGKAGPDVSITIPYHRFILSGTTLYRSNAQGIDPHYGLQLTIDADNKAASIAYTSAETNVVAFREAEDFLTPIVGNNYHAIRCSGMGSGKAPSEVNAFELPAGVYQMTAASYARSGYNFTFKVNGSTVFTHTGNGTWGTTTSGNITVPQGVPVQVVGGNDNYALDYVYAKVIFGYTTASVNLTKGSTTTNALINGLDMSGKTIRYLSENQGVATVNGTSGQVTAQHNGTTTITACLLTDANAALASNTWKSNAEYVATYTVTVTGETAATTTFTPASPTTTETFTVTGDGYLPQTANGSWMTLGFGNENEVQIVATLSGEHGVRGIDTNGLSHVYQVGGIPTMGSYFVITAKQNSLLSFRGYMNYANGIRLTDSEGSILERIPASEVTANGWKDYSFSTLLNSGNTYYVFPETQWMTPHDGANSPTLWVNSFVMTKTDGVIFNLIDQSLLFFPNTNGENNQLDRNIPGFDIAFKGDGWKYQDTKNFIVRYDAGGSANNWMKITPRLSSGSASDVTINNVMIIYENATSDPTVAVNGVGKTLSTSKNSENWASPSGSEITIALTSGSGTSFNIKAVQLTYTLNNGATFDNSKQDVTLTFEDDFVYGYDGDDIENDFYISTPKAYYGDVYFEGNVSHYGNGSGFGNANTDMEPVKTKDGSDHMTHYRDKVSGDYKVHIGQGVCKLIAVTPETNYFNAGYAETRLYSRDYVEERDEENKLVLGVGESYEVPAGDGLTFRLTTNGGTVLLTGTETTPDDVLTDGETFETTATGHVTIKNIGAASITLKRIEVTRKTAELSFGYIDAVGAENDVLFSGESYLPAIFSILSEENLYTIYENSGTYAITRPLAGVSINPATGELTVDSNADNGEVQVTMTLNPKAANKASYAPLVKTITLKVIAGMWDFRTYSQADHWSMYESDGWSGTENGWNVSRDNAEFDYILRTDGTPLPVAFTLQTRGSHRILHSNHGFLHLMGRKQSINGGGEVKVPVKRNMLIEINAYSEASMSEMELEGVTTLAGDDVTEYYVNEGAAESQIFLAKNDGYFIIKNPSSNLHLHICYIKVSADMVFEHGTDTYVDVDEGTWTNTVMNHGTATLSYVASNTTGTPVSAINTETGVVTIESDHYGVFTVTATGSGTGIFSGKTSTYTARVVHLVTANSSQNVSGAAATFNLKDCITTYGTDGNTDASLKDLVTFSVVNPLPTVSLSGRTLTVEGVQEVTVKATLGSIEKTFTCTVAGGSLSCGLNPVITNDRASAFVITLQGGGLSMSSTAPYSSTHYFDVSGMKSAAMGDIKASVNSLTFTENTESKTLTISGFDGVQKGGVIPIYASYVYAGNSYTIEGTLTIAYDSHVWRFQHNLIQGMNSDGEDKEEAAAGLASDALSGYGSSHGLTGGLRGWEPSTGTYAAYKDGGNTPTIDEPTDGGETSSSNHWHMTRKIGGHRDVSMVYYYNHPSEGNNALIIPETEGIHIYSTAADKQLGVEMNVGDNVSGVKSAQLVDGNYYCSNLMLLRGGKVVIPKVKPGQWIEVRWTRHKEDMGERILMKNLSDAGGKYIDDIYKIGNCYYNLGANSTSTYMFQVAAAGTERADGSKVTVDADGCVDVEFTIADNIYISIQQIELHEFGWDYRSSMVHQLNGYVDNNGMTDEALEAAADSWTKSTAPQIDWQYLWDDNAPHTLTFLAKELQNAPNAPQEWDFTIDPTFTDAQLSYDQGMISEAKLYYNEGWGKVTIKLTSYSQNKKYVANQKEWTITFGQAPKQTYPYTWDFTKYFNRTRNNLGTNTWDADDDELTVKYTNYDTNIYESYFVEGAQLVSHNLWEKTADGILPETAGLGFKLDNDADLVPDGTLTLDMQNHDVPDSKQHVSNKKTWAPSGGGLKIVGGGDIIVPRPPAPYENYYIYIHSSRRPTTVSNTWHKSAESGSYVNNNATDGQYKYQLKSDASGNVVIHFDNSSDAIVYAIGVTNVFKEVKKLGDKAWATESRDMAVDYTLDELLTTNPIEAYAIIQKGSNPVYSADKGKTTVRIEDQRYVIPANTGLILKQSSSVPGGVADKANYSIPLFAPAATTAQDNASEFAYNLMRPNLTSTEFTSETKNFNGTTVSDGTEYTIFFLTHRYMTWRKKGDSELTYDDHFTTGNVPAFYRMHLYGSTFDGETAAERNTLGANKAYLLLRSDLINAPIWRESGEPSREYIGIEGVSDMELIEEWERGDTDRPRNTLYNLQGQPMDADGPLMPGVYIRNGKKVIVRQ